MAKMIRKQIYIEAEQERQLKKLAQRLGVSEAQLIREALHREFGLADSKRQSRQRLDRQAWDEERRFIERLIAQGPVRGGRSWTRDELYEERLSRHGRGR